VDPAANFDNLSQLPLEGNRLGFKHIGFAQKVLAILALSEQEGTIRLPLDFDVLKIIKMAQVTYCETKKEGTMLTNSKC